MSGLTEKDVAEVLNALNIMRWRASGKRTLANSDDHFQRGVSVGLENAIKEIQAKCLERAQQGERNELA